jgi:hypothetical protein
MAKYLLEDSVSIATIDSYSETNYATTTKIGGSGAVEISQSFTGNGTTLGQVKFYGYMITPGGNMQAYIYAHSGTFGTSSVKTGVALATSDLFDASVVTTSSVAPQLYTITFSGANKITLANATNYVLVFKDISLAGGSNGLQMGYDSTTPTHAGNWALDSVADSLNDLIFYVQSATPVTNTTDGYLLEDSSGYYLLESEIIATATSSVIESGFLAGSARSWSHTIPTTATNNIVWVAVSLWQDVAGTGSMSGITYNGVAMTAGPVITSGAMRSELWYIIAPPTGTSTISATVSGATDERKFSAVSFAGVAQSSPVDTSNTQLTSGTSASISLTTTTANDMVIDSLAHFGTQFMTAGSNQSTAFNSFSGSSGAAVSYKNAATAGSNTTSWTTTGTNDIAYVSAAMKPVSTGSVLTLIQPAVARISATPTKSQPATARISKTATKTQPAISRISNIVTKTQSAIANITQSATKTQPATARIARNITKTQPGTARIAVSGLIKTQPAVSRISNTRTATQPAIARVARNLTLTQTSTARIANSGVVKTQSGTARIANIRSLTQGAVARIGQTVTKTQSGIARISNTRTTTQPATARIQKAVTKTQPAVAKIAISGLTKTQPAISRISNTFTKTQPAIARVARNLTKTQGAVARIANSGRVKTQGAIARIANNRALTQGATARVAVRLTKTQSGVSRISQTATKTQSAISRIAKTLTKTQTATASIQFIVINTKTIIGTARIYQTALVRKVSTLILKQHAPNVLTLQQKQSVITGKKPASTTLMLVKHPDTVLTLKKPGITSLTLTKKATVLTLVLPSSSIVTGVVT